MLNMKRDAPMDRIAKRKLDITAGMLNWISEAYMLPNPVNPIETVLAR